MEYNYKFPENFDVLFEMYARAMNLNTIINPIKRCKIKHRDLGFAYYAGLNGYWNYHAIDVDIIGSKLDLEIIQKNKERFITLFDRALDPENTGLVSRKFLFVPDHNLPDHSDSECSIKLPEENDPMLKTLRFEIIGNIEKGDPTLALDRLHTFVTKFLRKQCVDNGVAIKNANDNYLPLHSIMGNLCKYYKDNNLIESEFSLRALKNSISLFESFNEVRNSQSYAHDNKVLNKDESTLVVEIIASILNFISIIQSELLNDADETCAFLNTFNKDKE